MVVNFAWDRILTPDWKCLNFILLSGPWKLDFGQGSLFVSLPVWLHGLSLFFTSGSFSQGAEAG